MGGGRSSKRRAYRKGVLTGLPGGRVRRFIREKGENHSSILITIYNSIHIHRGDYRNCVRLLRRRQFQYTEILLRSPSSHPQVAPSPFSSEFSTSSFQPPPLHPLHARSSTLSRSHLSFKFIVSNSLCDTIGIIKVYVLPPCCPLNFEFLVFTATSADACRSRVTSQRSEKLD